MRSIFIALALAVFSVGAAGLQGKAKTTIKCPVMTGNKVNIANATKTKMFADYKGRRYFFCCPGCPAVFKKSPEKFKKAESIPTPKKKA